MKIKNSSFALLIIICIFSVILCNSCEPEFVYPSSVTFTAEGGHESYWGQIYPKEIILDDNGRTGDAIYYGKESSFWGYDSVYIQNGWVEVRSTAGINAIDLRVAANDTKRKREMLLKLISDSETINIKIRQDK